MVVDALDNFETRCLLNEFCVKKRKPLVHGDLPPLIVPLVKLESMELWSREQVPGNLRHCAALPGYIPSSILQ